VAQLSGVSRATVSYVLNATPNQSISEETRRRVLDAAEELGYTPFAPARALRAGRSEVVLYLIPEWPIGPNLAQLVEVLTLNLAQAGLTLVVHAHPRSARPVGDLWKTIAPAVVINDQVLSAGEEEAARQAGIRVVVPGFAIGGGTFADFQREAGRRQAEHLAACGHTRLGYALPHDERLAAFAEPRLEGVRQVCARLGLGEPDTRVVPLHSAAAADTVEHWHRAAPRVSGVCAYNDEVALALLAGLREQRLTAPGDLAVIGMDDIPAAALAFPPLTTLALGMPELGGQLATAVADTLDGKPVPPGPGPDAIRIVRRNTT
jgi:DNA-binding LacI/PurR family transcriptional regulator